MSNLNYLGPWQWSEIPRPGWYPPPGTVGNLDLRSLEEQGRQGLPGSRPWGFFFGTAALDNRYLFLGEGDPRDLSPGPMVRTRWGQMIGRAPAGPTVANWLWDLLTEGSDPDGGAGPAPLITGYRPFLSLVIGNTPLRVERFNYPSHSHSAKMAAALRRRFRQIWDRAPVAARRWLGRRCIDLRTRRWWDFVPPEIQIAGPLPPRTEISESFNKPNSTVLGPDLVWTEIGGEWAIQTNNAVCSSATDALARADTDLSSDDHYSEAPTLTTGQYAAGVIGRKDSTASFTFYLAQIDVLLGEWNLYKCVGGTYTRLGGTAGAAANVSYLMRLTCDGSTITGKRDGVVFASVTDTAISGNLRCGLRAVHTASTSFFGSFTAADLGPIPLDFSGVHVHGGAFGFGLAEQLDGAQVQGGSHILTSFTIQGSGSLASGGAAQTGAGGVTFNTGGHVQAGGFDLFSPGGLSGSPGHVQGGQVQLPALRPAAGHHVQGGAAEVIVMGPGSGLGAHVHSGSYTLQSIPGGGPRGTGVQPPIPLSFFLEEVRPMQIVARFVKNTLTELAIDPTLAGAGPVSTPTARLWKNNFTPTENSVAADFEECDFSGYAAAPVTWLSAGVGGDGEIEAVGESVTWNQTTTAVTNVAYGVFYTDAGGVFLWAEKFLAPVLFGSADRIFGHIPRFRLPETIPAS